MKFDVVIGNPPYHKMDQAEDSEHANAAMASPIYQDFHAKAEHDFEAKIIIMVVPAKCLSGGKGLDGFRRDVLRSKRVKQIVRRRFGKGWFPGVGTRDGNIVYHWERDFQGRISFTTETGDVNIPKTDTVSVDPTKYDIMLMDVDAMTMPLLDKVLKKAEGNFIQPLVQTPYGLYSNYFTKTEYSTQWVTGHAPKDPTNPTVMCAYGDSKNRGAPQFRPVLLSQVTKNLGTIGHWKIITAKGGLSGGVNGLNFLSDMFIIEPGHVCTQTYLVIGSFDTQAEALNMRAVIDTPLYQWMAQHRIAGNMSPDVFRWMPKLDWTRPWTAKDIYAKFGLTDQEIAYVEAYMKHVTDKRAKYAR